MFGLLNRLRHRVTGSGPADAPAEPAAAEPAPGRRHRDPTPSERQLTEEISQKLLHGWLENRHQTLMPLSLNLARIPAEDREPIARFAAIAACAGTDARAPERVRQWLDASGADADTLAAYEAALDAPPPLARALADMASPECAGIAYVLALVAARDGVVGDAGHAFADYVAKRLALPNSALRSAERRYRL
jgi:hypothetical protein